MDKKLLLIPGYLVGCGGLALITYRTVLAFSSSSKAITVQVNRFGEQYLDLVALVLLWVVCVVGLWSLTQLLKEPNRRKEHTDAGLGMAPHDGFPPFFVENQGTSSFVSLGVSSTDVAGFVSLGSPGPSSAASVSVTVVQQNLTEAV